MLPRTFTHNSLEKHNVEAPELKFQLKLKMLQVSDDTSKVRKTGNPSDGASGLENRELSKAGLGGQRLPASPCHCSSRSKGIPEGCEPGINPH